VIEKRINNYAKHANTAILQSSSYYIAMKINEYWWELGVALSTAYLNSCDAFVDDCVGDLLQVLWWYKGDWDRILPYVCH